MTTTQKYFVNLFSLPHAIIRLIFIIVAFGILLVPVVVWGLSQNSEKQKEIGFWLRDIIKGINET